MIFFGSNIAEKIKQFAAEAEIDKLFLLADENTRKYCFDVFSEISTDGVLVIPSGEKNKNLENASKIWEWLVDNQATRHSAILCLGGGTITDLGGFAASTYQRGIKCIYIPTTLLAMVDAAIGGKTGINFHGLKNYVGTFHQPLHILINTSFLKTLPDDEWINGKAEIIKHAMLKGAELYEMTNDFIHQRSDPQQLLNLVKANAAFKQSVVDEDFTEKHRRTILNFGHTAAHALESLYLSKGITLPHGQAVMAGMLIETKCGTDMQIVSNHVEKQLSSLLQGFPAVSFEQSDIKQLTGYALADKKKKGNGIAMSLVREAGEPLPLVFCPEDIFEKSLLDYLHDYCKTTQLPG